MSGIWARDRAQTLYGNIQVARGCYIKVPEGVGAVIEAESVGALPKAIDVARRGKSRAELNVLIL